MSIKCLIIDDEPLAIQIIKAHVEQVPDLELVASFQNPLEAFELLKTTAVDLIFLDIHMPLLTGIDFVKSLQHPPKVIFTTAFRDYAIESYELDIVDYLLKPVTFSRFFKAINKFNSLILAPVASPSLSENVDLNNDHLYVNINKKFVKVPFNEILYVESIKDYIRIHTPDQPIVTKDRISEFAKKLPSGFLRIHRSFIVNVSKISAFTAVDVEIGETEVPIGESYKREVMACLKKT